MQTLLRVFTSRRMVVTFGLGISSGLPLLLIGSTLKAWLKKEGIDLAVIGVFSIVGLPYTLKFLWSPLLDRYTLPWLGRRRGWILLCQLILAGLLAAMACVHPQAQPMLLGCLAFAIAFFSASQDIAIDAYRRDILEENELGLGSSLAVNGYRVGMLLAGGFALILADQMPWSSVYGLMALLLFLAAGITVLSPEPPQQERPPVNLKEAIFAPFSDFFKRSNVVAILLFILAFKIGDSMASDMINPLLLDLGFSLTEIGAVAKLFGFWATIGGGILGGIGCIYLGTVRALWVFGILQTFSTMGFSLLPFLPKSNFAMGGVILFENLCTSMATTAYVGFMAALCNKRFTATQYALLSSLAGVPRVIFGASSGFLAKKLGWSEYYFFCTTLHLPGMLLLLYLSRNGRVDSAQRSAS